MKYIRDAVIEEASHLGITLKELDSETGKGIVERVASKYANGYKNWLWEHLSVPRFSVQDANAWSWIDQLLDKIDGSVIMFFNSRDDSTVLEFSHPSDVVSVLAETFHFEFYLSDNEASYFLCFNHHDVLVAAGAAKLWLEAFVENRAK